MRGETRQTVVLVVGTGVTTLLSLVYTTFVAQKLGPAGSADFFGGLSVLAFCQIALAPINGTVAKFAAMYIGEGALGKVRALNRAMTIRVSLFSLFVGFVSLLLLKPLSRQLQFDSLDCLLLAFGSICVSLILSISRGVLRGAQAFGLLNWNMIVESATRLPIGLAVLVWFPSSGGALFAYFASLVVTLVLSRVQIERVWRGHTPIPIDGREIRQFAGPMWITNITAAAYQNVDMLFVKRYFTDADAGLYGAVFSLSRMMGALVTPFNIMMLPLLTTLHGQGRGVGRTFLRISLQFLALASIPITIFAIWPEDVMRLLYGPEFAAAGAILLPLAIGRLAGYLCQMIALGCAAIDRFEFLIPYVAGLIAQAVAMTMWHGSLRTVVLLLLALQTGTLIAVGAIWAVAARKLERKRS